MSRWTHACCPDCWRKQHPGSTPATIVDKTVEQCCFCGEQTGAGIYVRHDPAELRCGGEHV